MTQAGVVKGAGLVAVSLRISAQTLPTSLFDSEAMPGASEVLRPEGGHAREIGGPSVPRQARLIQRPDRRKRVAMSSQSSDTDVAAPSLPPQLPATGAQEPRPTGPSRRTRPFRLALIAGLALAVAALATAQVVSQGPATDTVVIQVRARMGAAGFEPMGLTVKAGQAVKIELTSMDGSLHSDGGGWHQFAIDALGIDWKVGPLSSRVFEFTAPSKPATYSYYCDTCCGGKENPAMQGKLTVST
jgi:cytochrome c oxidase subunit II